MAQADNVTIASNIELRGDELYDLIASNPVSLVWEDIGLNSILRQHVEMGSHAKMEEYLLRQVESDNERAILIFLDSLRHGSWKTVEVYARYIVGYINFIKKSYHKSTFPDVRNYLVTFTGLPHLLLTDFWKNDV